MCRDEVEIVCFADNYFYADVLILLGQGTDV